MLAVEPLRARLFGIATFDVAGCSSPIRSRYLGTKYVVWARVVRVHHQCACAGAKTHVVHVAKLHDVGEIGVEVLINVLQVDEDESVHELPWLSNVTVEVVEDDLMLPQLASTSGDAVPNAVQRVENTRRASMNSPIMRG